MIDYIEISDPEKSYFPFWKKIGLPSRLEFKPGLNLIVGTNGCGKSTVLRTLARYLFCEKGYQVFDQGAYNQNSLFGACLDGIKVGYDGSPVAYYTRRYRLGRRFGCGAALY